MKMRINNDYMVLMSRQLGLWGAEGQNCIQQSHVAVGGLGGIGAVSALMLAKAGVGRVRVADRDAYEPENVVEQVFAAHDVLGRAKAEVATAEMSRHTRTSRCRGFTADLAVPANADRLAAGVDVLIAGVDNPEARFSLWRACAKRRIPMVVSANVGWSVFHTVYLPDGPGYLAPWEGVAGLKWRGGAPDLKDPATLAVVRREWKLWAVALGDYTPEALRGFLADDQSYYWYAAPQAFFAASMGVLDTLKLIAGVGAVTAYPEVYYHSMRANRRLGWEELSARRDALNQAWDQGAEAVVAAVRHWQQAEGAADAH